MEIKPLGIIGGVIILISLFLPWVTMPVIGTFISFFDIVSAMNFSAIDAQSALLLISFILLILGGIISMIFGSPGGVLAIFGLILLTVSPFLSPGIFDANLFFSMVGYGYYVAIVGAIISSISSVIKIKRQPPTYQYPPRQPPTYPTTTPSYPATQQYPQQQPQQYSIQPSQPQQQYPTSPTYSETPQQPQPPQQQPTYPYQPQPQPQVPPQPTYRCPVCGNPLTWIPQYQRWYCYTCRRYY